MPDPKFHHKTSAKTLEQLTEISGGTLVLKNDVLIEDVAPLSTAGKTDISFLDNVKYKDDFKNTQAGVVIISEKMKEHAPDACNLIISNSPYKSYALIAQAFYPDDIGNEDISESAYIHSTATIGSGCVIGSGAVIAQGVILGDNVHINANATIEKNVQIGTGTRIGANASITHAIIGEYCNIYAGVRIGQDGFGFAIDPKGHVKVPQLGRVLIGNHVEIGANSCVDRGAGPDTEIGDGTWIDNLAQIGHNVKIGRGCVIIAQAGIAGSTVLEDYVVIAAQVGVAGHLTVGMGAKVAAQSGVMRNVPAQTDVMGTPAIPIKEELRTKTFLRKLAAKK